MSGRVIIISGYFNPIHSGHLDYIESAKEKGDYLIVIVNNDKQVDMKGSVQFMCQEERLRLVSSIKGEGGIAEEILEEELGVNMLYNLGGEKTQSSSNLIEKAGKNGIV